MPNIIRIKRRVTGAAGAPTGLKSAELAYNMADNTVYAGYGDDGSGNATAVKPIGGEGTFAKLDSPALIGTPTGPTPAGADNSKKLATTAFIKGLGYLTDNNTITISGDASGSGTTAIALTLASIGTAGTYAKVTTDAKGRVTSGTTLSATDIPALTSAKISDFDTQVRASRLDQMAAPTVALSLNAQKISNLADPASAQDAATKAYVDATRQGLDVKDSVRAATTANITLSATQTVDGVALVAGDRVLVKDQSTASANGIYVVAAGAWSRAVDADSSAKVTAGKSMPTPAAWRPACAPPESTWFTTASSTRCWRTCPDVPIRCSRLPVHGGSTSGAPTTTTSRSPATKPRPTPISPASWQHSGPRQPTSLLDPKSAPEQPNSSATRLSPRTAPRQP